MLYELKFGLYEDVMHHYDEVIFHTSKGRLTEQKIFVDEAGMFSAESSNNIATLP